MEGSKMPDFLWKSYQVGCFTDLLIKFRGTTYNTHKLVVCNQSSVFNALCSGGGFKLGSPLSNQNQQTAIIELDDDPEVSDLHVRCLIRFLYRSEYCSFELRPVTEDTCPPDTPRSTVNTFENVSSTDDDTPYDSPFEAASTRELSQNPPDDNISVSDGDFTDIAPSKKILSSKEKTKLKKEELPTRREQQIVGVVEETKETKPARKPTATVQETSNLWMRLRESTSERPKHRTYEGQYRRISETCPEFLASSKSSKESDLIQPSNEMGSLGTAAKKLPATTFPKARTRGEALHIRSDGTMMSKKSEPAQSPREALRSEDPAVNWFSFAIDADGNELAPRFHATMYALAVKYDIKPLAVYSSNIYVQTLGLENPDLRFSGLLDSIGTVYKTTPTSDRQLRDLAALHAKKYIRHIEDGERLHELVREVPEFAADVIELFRTS